MSEYDYTVQFVGNYWSMNTRISLDLDEQEGNASEETREKAIELADEMIAGDIGFSPVNFANSVLVTLNLVNEDLDI